MKKKRLSKRILKRIEKEEKVIEKLEKRELKDLGELKRIEEQIKQEVVRKPLKSITSKDMARGLVGSFFGIVAHFAFIEGVNVSEKFNFTMLRSTLLLITAFFVGFIFLYSTGYRKIKDKKFLFILPVRLIIIFGVSIIAILSALALFGVITSESTFQSVYKQVAVISLPAIIGAITADIIGNRNE